MSSSLNKKVDRVEKFASFEMENGIGVAINLTTSHNGRFYFKTSNMRFGSLKSDSELLWNDEKLVELISNYYNQYMNFNKCNRADTRIEKFEWFIKSRLPLHTDLESPELIKNILFYALKTIKFIKDQNGSMMFSIEDIDNCISQIIKQKPLNKEKRLIS